MRNPYKKLIDLLPQRPLQVGTVASHSDGVATITLPGGGTVQARGEANVGDHVFVRDSVIEGLAPTLPVELITV